MIIKKYTSGFAIQTFDTGKNRFVSQEFIAGESEYEMENGTSIDPSVYMPLPEPYLPFEMKQPGEIN
jgi:hypothetical protein